MREWDRHGTYNWDTGKYEYGGDEPTVYILAEDNDGSGYDWDITAIVARKIGDTWEYAVYEDGGCSCNGAYENSPEEYDLAWNDNSFAVFKAAAVGMTVADRASFRTEFNQSLKELLNDRTA